MTTHSTAINLSIVFALLLLTGHVANAQESTAMAPTVIEIFGTTDRPISTIDTFSKRHPNIELHIHQLDHIKILEDELSLGLSADPVRAKHRVLERMRQLTPGTRNRLEHSARSLVRAAQYGVHKVPAIVFDGELVIYGLTDLSLALMHYQRWRASQRS